MSLPDYNYHTSPELLQTVVDGLGGWPAVLTFCQTHDVTVERGSDGMEMLRVVRDDKAGYYSTELDVLSAIVMGMKAYMEYNKSMTNNEQRKLILTGKLYYSSNGEQDDLLKLEGADYFLAEELEEISGHTVTVRYWASEQPMTDEQRTEETIRAYTGALRSEYSVAYSEITGYLWTNEYLEVGGHNLLEELATYVDKYLHIEVIIHG